MTAQEHLLDIPLYGDQDPRGGFHLPWLGCPLGLDIIGVCHWLWGHKWEGHSTAHESLLPQLENPLEACSELLWRFRDEVRKILLDDNCWKSGR